MKASCNREGLLTAVQVAAGVIPARTPKPILRNFKLELSKKEGATLLATDLELGLRYKVSGVEVEEEGQAILPSGELMKILREVNDERLVLESTNSGVRVAAASARFDLPGEDPLQFPEVAQFEAKGGHKIKAAMLGNMIRRTVFAVAAENARYALHSVLIEIDATGDARLVATDGKRLALMPGKATLSGEAPTGIHLIPPRTMSLLQKILLDPEEEVEIALRENEALFRTSKVTLYSRLVEGRFPKYQEVFPPKPNVQIPLPVGKFSGIIRQAMIVTNEESKGVEFNFADGTLTLVSQSADLGQSEVRMPISYTGDEMKITYDPQLILDLLRVLEPEDEISLDLVDTKRASVFRTRDKYECVVMPLTRDRA